MQELRFRNFPFVLPSLVGLVFQHLTKMVIDGMSVSYRYKLFEWRGFQIGCRPILSSSRLLYMYVVRLTRTVYTVGT